MSATARMSRASVPFGQARTAARPVAPSARAAAVPFPARPADGYDDADLAVTTDRVTVIQYADYRAAFEVAAAKFKFIALFARIDFYLLLVLQSVSTAIATFSDSIFIDSPTLSTSQLSFVMGAISLVVTALIAVLPLQRVNLQCTEAFAIMSTHLLSKAPLPHELFVRIARADTLCCANPLRVQPRPVGCFYWCSAC